MLLACVQTATGNWLWQEIRKVSAEQELLGKKSMQLGCDALATQGKVIAVGSCLNSKALKSESRSAAL